MGSEKKGSSCSKWRDIIFRCLHIGRSTGDCKEDQQAESWASQGTVSQKTLSDQLSISLCWSIDLTSTDYKSECTTYTHIWVPKVFHLDLLPSVNLSCLNRETEWHLMCLYLRGLSSPLQAGEVFYLLCLTCVCYVDNNLSNLSKRTTA